MGESNALHNFEEWILILLRIYKGYWKPDGIRAHLQVSQPGIKNHRFMKSI